MSRKKIVPIIIAIAMIAGLWVAWPSGPSPVREVSRTVEVNAPQAPATPTSTPVVVDLADGPFALLEENLGMLDRVPPLRKQGRELLAQLPAYRSFLQQQLREGDVSEIQISFIWNMHPMARSDTQDLARLRAGQDGVVQLLGDNNYQLVGVEGRYADRFNIPQFRRDLLLDTQETARELRLPFERRIYESILQSYLTDYAVYRYLVLHSSQPAFGIEPKKLHRMHSDLIGFLQDVRPVDNGYWSALNRTLLDARSVMALARAVHCARLHNVQTVGIPYGIAHQPFISRLKEHFKISGEDRIAPGTPR